MMTIKVDGATCQGCVKSIEKALAQVEGVQSATFDLESKLATVEGTDNQQAVVDAIEMAGFDVITD